MKKEFVIVSVALLLSACATGGPNRGPTYMYEEIEVVNNSEKPIRNMTVRATGTDHVFNCESIIALGLCQGRFASRRFKEGTFSIDWVFGDSAAQTSEIEVAVPAYNSPGIPLTAMIEISPEGVITAYFKQDTRRI